jgi:lysophospholipase L1-like esterase
MKPFLYGALVLGAAMAFACLQPISAAGPGTGGAGVRGFGGGGLGGFGFGGFGGGGGATQPAIQGGENSRIAHEHLLTKAKLGKGKIDVYFEGDSIFRRWGCSDPNWSKYLKNWNANFFGWNAADFAWGADLVQNILWRLQNGELDDVNPKVVVFLGGTNNLNPRGGDALVTDVTNGLKACFDTIQQKAPDATLIIVGILPRQSMYQTVIDQINANLAKMADGKKTRYVDMKDKYLDENGRLVPGMLTTDSLHPDIGGYQAIADKIKPILTEILGPPAKEDHAPPPSGDPKVRPVYPPKETAPVANP